MKHIITDSKNVSHIFEGTYFILKYFTDYEQKFCYTNSMLRVKLQYNFMKHINVPITVLCISTLIALQFFPGFDIPLHADADKATNSDPFSEPKAIPGDWNISKNAASTLPADAENTQFSIQKLDKRTYFVDLKTPTETDQKISCGAILNFKYFSGLSYDYLQKELPGKKVSINISFPKKAISANKIVPNMLRATIKAQTRDKWYEYYETEWVKIKDAGNYPVSITIPPKSIGLENGQIYKPEDTTAFVMEYYLTEGTQHTPYLFFSFSGFNVPGIDFDENDLKWQMIKNGHTITDRFLPSFEKNSLLINAMGTALDMDYAISTDTSGITYPMSGDLTKFYISLPVFIPEELRRQKGILSLTIRNKKGLTRSSVKNFDTCTLEGIVFLTLPLDIFTVQKDLNEICSEMSVNLRIKTAAPHTDQMFPMVVLPLRLYQGQLIPFDDKWHVRDIQNLGGYKELYVGIHGAVAGDGVTVEQLSADLYHLNANFPIQGGIDWKNNAFYRVELMRDFGAEPVNMENMHLEVLITPMTDTQFAWQSPYRARLGLMDEKGRVMFGPNISLSEGVSSMASLDVSVTSSIPKGFVMPDFDPKKVKSLLINIEASQALYPKTNINIFFNNLVASARQDVRPGPLKNISYERFKRDPGTWEISKLIKNTGGYLVGINYPFPVIPVSTDVLEVPQIYPSVGKKPTDIEDFGFSYPLTKETATKDIKIFAQNNIDVVRIMLLGHLDGVFSWDEKGIDIKGFDGKDAAIVQENAGKSVENLVKYLDENQSTSFLKYSDGSIKGLEPHVLNDIYALFDILDQVKKDTGKRVMVILSLYDFLLGDGSKTEGPLRRYTVGEHLEVVTSPEVKTKAHMILWALMKELTKDPRFYEYVACVEIMNEPDNATELATKKRMNDLVNFVAEGLYILKDAIGPKVPVSVGFRSWPGDLRYWKTVADGIDIFMIHYWEALESYNINTHNLWPLDMPAEKLWDFLGTKRNGRITGMGEISPLGNIRENLFKLEGAGYDFTLIWSYSGHDGYNAKPIMQNLAEYQTANRKMLDFATITKDQLEKAFFQILESKKTFLFSRSITDIDAATDKPFKDNLRATLDKTSDPVIQQTIKNIVDIATLKEIPLDQKHLKELYQILSTKIKTN